MQIVYFGTPSFAADLLQYLIDHQVKIAAVVTKPDRPKGRSSHPLPTPVKLIAQNQNPPLPVHQPEFVSSPDFAETLRAYQADLFIVVAYGEILKQNILDIPPKGCINVHASLLPKYRGAAPIQRSIINGETETGISIMYMVKKMDAGAVIQKVSVPIGPDTTYGQLEQLLCETGAKALLDVIHKLEKGTLHSEEQDHSQATLAPKIELEECEIKWTLPAQVIHNLVRGVNPHPGAWCYVQVNGQQKRLKVLLTEIVKDRSGSPGSLIPSDDLIVACGDAAIKLLDVQLEGKKVMHAIELMRGMSKGTFLMI